MSVSFRAPISDERREALRKEAQAHTGFKRPYSFLDPAELLQLLDEAEDLAAYQLRLQKGNAHLAFEIVRRDEVLGWLRENMPRALELCPYKLGGESVSREARAVEGREPDGGDPPVPNSPSGVNEDALTAAHLAVEDVLIDMRDRRISVLGAANGFVVREADGADSNVIRVWSRDGLRIAIRAYLEALA